MKECELYDHWLESDGGDDESGDLENDGDVSTTTLVTENHSLNIRKRAAIIQKQFESTFTDETKQLIQEEDVRVKSILPLIQHLMVVVMLVVEVVMKYSD